MIEVEIGEPSGSELCVRNEWMSLDPYMRLLLTEQAGFVAALRPGDLLGGSAVGVVEKSADPAFPVGARVLSQMGWRSRFVATPDDANLVVVNDTDVPPEWHLGVLGLTGITAWLGIDEVLRPVAGETIFVSGAAGAVGSIACQLAKLRGARVLGSAGSDVKAAWLVDALGVDAVVNYHDQSTEDFLAEHAPEGVDCYFDNVGGSMLGLLLTRTRPGGRIGLCGAMSQYEGGNYRSGPADFFSVIENNLRLEGFNAFRLSPDRWNAIAARLKVLVQDRLLTPCYNVLDGLENVPEAFVNMFHGSQCGKLLVRI